MNVKILHQDLDSVAFDKPPGLLTIPGRTGEGPNLRDVGAAQIGRRLWVVHRLDRDTSGVVLFALTAEAHRALNTAFEGREVRKGYLALVRGEPSEEEGVIDLPLRAGRKGRTVVAEEGGKASVTRWRVVERLGSCTLIEALPETGRSHQIRVHLAAVGMPLVVDPLYGLAGGSSGSSVSKGRESPPTGWAMYEGGPTLTRTPLHAAWIDAPHPRGGRLRVEAPLPEDMRRAVDKARV